MAGRTRDVRSFEARIAVVRARNKGYVEVAPAHLAQLSGCGVGDLTVAATPTIHGGIRELPRVRQWPCRGNPVDQSFAVLRPASGLVSSPRMRTSVTVPTAVAFDLLREEDREREERD